DQGLGGSRDESLSHLVHLPNVLVTGHQGFFTREALEAIAAATMAAADAFAAGRPCPNTLISPSTSVATPPPPAPHGSVSGFTPHPSRATPDLGPLHRRPEVIA